MHTYNDKERVAMSPVGGYRCYKGTAQAFANATGGTPAAITGLSFPIKKGEVWHIAAKLKTTGVSGGGKVSISGPASPNILSVTAQGIVGGITASSTDKITALDTLTQAYNTTAVDGDITLDGIIGASADGTVQLNAANVTNSNSFSVNVGSTLIATRLA